MPIMNAYWVQVLRIGAETERKRHISRHLYHDPPWQLRTSSDMLAWSDQLLSSTDTLLDCSVVAAGIRC
jgi:hypothetical protein